MRRFASAILALLLALDFAFPTAMADGVPGDRAGGVPDHFDIAIAGTLVADGTSTADVSVHGVDRFGHDAARDFPVTVTIASGSLLLREAGVDPSTVAGSERVETKLGERGTVHLAAYATTTPGEVRINALAEGVVTAGLGSTIVFVMPYAKVATVVGLVTAGVGSVPGDVDGSDIFDNGNSRKGRLALYGSGSIADKTVGTFAYESANRLDPTYGFGAYTLDPNERPYLTYGDAGTRTSDALSQGHFFGDVERGRDSLEYGEFSAQTGTPSSVDSFAELISGVKLHLSDAAGSSWLTLFNASNDVQYGRVSFNPLGLAQAGPVLPPNLIVGSEIVTLVALDRRSGAVLSATQLVRNVDYAIDYASGSLRFINIPLPFDAEFNPQVVVVQFQFDGTGSKAQTTGGSGRLLLGTTALEAGYANDANGIADSVVSSQRIHGTLGAGTWQISHGATSGGDPALTTEVPLARSNGDNIHLDADVPFGPNRIFARYDNTTLGYDNVFGGFATPGLADARVGWERKFGNASLSAGYERQSDASTGNYQREFGAHYRAKPSARLSFTAGLQAVSASGFAEDAASPVFPSLAPVTPVAPATTATTSNAAVPGGSTVQAEIGATWQVTHRISFTADRTQDIGPPLAAIPAQTSAEIAYAFPKGRAYVRELWSDGPSYTVPQSTADFSALSQATHATIVGVSSDTSPMTSIGSAYVVEQTNSGEDAYTTYGVKQRFIIDPALRGDAFLQSGAGSPNGVSTSSVSAAGNGSPAGTSSTAADGSGFTVWGVNLAYEATDRVRAAVSWQDRSGISSGTVLNAGASGRISPEFSLAANVNSSHLTDYDTDDSRVGLAWRPSGTNRVAALFSFEDVSGQYATTTTSDTTQVITYDQLYRPAAQVELAGRLAYKMDGDADYAAHTVLFGLRALLRLGRKADIAGEWQALSTPAIVSTAQSAFAFEFGYRIGSSLRVATGYNFSGSADPSLIGRPVRRGIYFTATSTIDRIFGWGRGDARPR